MTNYSICGGEGQQRLRAAKTYTLFPTFIILHLATTLLAAATNITLTQCKKNTRKNTRDICAVNMMVKTR